jgi:hypothetical protein
MRTNESGSQAAERQELMRRSQVEVMRVPGGKLWERRQRWAKVP